MPPGAPAAGNRATGWDFDQFDDGSAKEVARERELKKLKDVGTAHREKLLKVASAVETNLGVSFDRTLAPLQLNMEPYESLGILQLVRTPNKVHLQARPADD